MVTIDDPYATLGVPQNVSAGDLKRAYHRLSHEWHPDHHMQASDAQRQQANLMFKQINHAYVVISTALRSTPVDIVPNESVSQPITAQAVPSAPRTLREIQLEAVAFACSPTRLMIIAQNWTIHPHKFRREVELVCRILSDAVVWGSQAFPGGFKRVWPQYLFDDNLTDQEDNVRQILVTVMDMLARNVKTDPALSLETWEPIFRLIDPRWSIAPTTSPGRPATPPSQRRPNYVQSSQDTDRVSRLQTMMIAILSLCLFLMILAIIIKLLS